MNVRDVNQLLLSGNLGEPGLLPHLESLQEVPFQFQIQFGLDQLPEEPGLILIRGARQYGKSTWLEGQIKSTVERFGVGSALYLNGDEIPNSESLVELTQTLLPLFSKHAQVRRLFVDEITAIKDWEKGLKRLIDGGELKKVLVVTTGSKANDLRRGAERLPGRKGRLDRTSYVFVPVAYSEFKRQCGTLLGEQTLISYLLAGGSPVACAEIATRGHLPGFVPQMMQDWVLGECAASGRHRSSLLSVMECLLRKGGTPIGQALLAREAGLANNTIAAGYVELLMDLLCLASAHVWDASRNIRLARKPCKYHFINLLAAVSWHPARLRTVEDFCRLSADQQGPWFEWLVAQELWLRACIRGEEIPELLPFWQGKEHEIDFVLSPTSFLEVKRGAVTPMEFSWFSKSLPKAHLTVVGSSSFETDQIHALPLEQFLLEDES